MKIKSILSALTLVVATGAVAQDLDITLTNLTQGLYFTPIVTATHTDAYTIFTSGEMATNELQAMAEGGDISGLVNLMSMYDADINENPAMGLLAPATSTTYSITTSDGNNFLSLTAMILPSNDGFTGISQWKIPEEAGTYTISLNAYDAGTEANDELITGGDAPGVAGIPAAPGGNAGSNGTGVTTTEDNTMVHIHPGTLGDDEAMGGKSDLTHTVHRWLNPVATLTIIVK